MMRYKPYDNHPAPPKIDTSGIESVLAAQSNNDLIKILIKMVEKLSIQNTNNIQVPPQETPSVSISMDVEKIIKSMPQQKAPIINMNTDSIAEAINSSEKNPHSYVFDIERDGHGRIKQVTATPAEV